MLILASQSPQRQELLQKLAIPFVTIPSTYNEHTAPKMNVHKLSEYLAVQKAYACIIPQKYPEILVIAADTLIVFKGKVYGKPQNKEEARNMLTNFSKKRHVVYTGLAVYNPTTQKIFSCTSKNTVWFGKIDVERYLKTKEWQQVAGSYRIQGQAQTFIKHIAGSYSSIMGLPLFELTNLLKKHRML